VKLASGIYYYEITVSTPSGGVVFKDIGKIVAAK
jgi:hypothetical protein